MFTENITFENMPAAMAYLISKVESLQDEIQVLKDLKQSAACETLTIEALINYLPGHPARQTIYGWASKKEIPYHKLNNKTLYFIKAEIDDWLLGNRHKTDEEIADEAAAFLANKDAKKYGV